MLEENNEEVTEPKKKFTHNQMRKSYSRQIEMINNKNALLMQQRNLKQHMEEQEELNQKNISKERTKEFFTKHNVISTKESPRFLDRMDKDIERRTHKYKHLQKEKQTLENLKVFNLINSSLKNISVPK